VAANVDHNASIFILMQLCHASDQIPELYHQGQALKASAISHNTADDCDDDFYVCRWWNTPWWARICSFLLQEVLALLSQVMCLTEGTQ